MFECGDKVKAIGQLKTRPPIQYQSVPVQNKCRYWFEVNNCTLVSQPSTNALLLGDGQKQDVEARPWELTCHLADRFSSGILPEGYARSAVLASLLSLLSGVQTIDEGKTSDPLHMLIVTDDVLLRRLLENARNMHENCVVYNQMPKKDDDLLTITDGAFEDMLLSEMRKILNLIFSNQV